MRRPLVTYDFATAHFWISLHMRKVCFLFYHCTKKKIRYAVFLNQNPSCFFNVPSFTLRKTKVVTSRNFKPSPKTDFTVYIHFVKGCVDWEINRCQWIIARSARSDTGTNRQCTTNQPTAETGRTTDDFQVSLFDALCVKDCTLRQVYVLAIKEHCFTLPKHREIIRYSLRTQILVNLCLVSISNKAVFKAV